MAVLADRYGFVLAGLSAEETRTRGASAARETTMANRWAKVDTSLFDPAQPVSSPSKTLKALVRGGIPVDLRPKLWLHFSGGAARKAAAPPRYYAALLQRAASATHTGAVDAAELGAELTRAFGTHPILTSVKGMRAVLRLLEAFQLQCASKGGLGRGMACIAAFMLVVMGIEREEDAFWTLVGLVEDRLPHSCVLQNTKGPGVEQRVLDALLTKRCPKAMAQLARTETPLEEVTASWFHSLFCTALPSETTARIWDVLLLEGPKILFRVGLALFKMNEPALLGTKLSGQVGRCLKWRIARCYDADALLKVAFSGIGSLPMAVIKRARADYEGIVQEQQDEYRRRLQAVLSSPRTKKAADESNSPTSSEAGGSPAHLSTIYEESEESLEPFSAISFLRVLRPLQAIIG